MEIPSQVNDVRTTMKGFQKPWFICGGWAIDLYLGKKNREHDDIDIGIFREDQKVFQNYLRDWKLYKIIESEMVTWKENELLTSPVHEIKAIQDDTEIEILLNDSNETQWLYRRDNSISYPKEQLIQYRENIPYWPPEISLLYKTKKVRPKDEQDFESVINNLSLQSKEWLKHALQKTTPEHQWLQRL